MYEATHQIIIIIIYIGENGEKSFRWYVGLMMLFSCDSLTTTYREQSNLFLGRDNLKNISQMISTISERTILYDTQRVNTNRNTEKH